MSDSDMAPDAVLEMVRRALDRQPSAAAVALAREAGFREGYAAGRLEARQEWESRIRGLLGAAQAAGELAASEAPAPRVPSPLVPAVMPAAATMRAGGPPPAAWKTAARAAVMQAEWPVNPSLVAIRARLDALEGPAVSHGDGALYRWAAALGLARPARAVRAPVPVEDWRTPARAARVRELGPREALPAGRDEAADVAPVAALPAGEIRETPFLRRAREMLAMGMHPNDIRGAVKLSATEFQAVQREHGHV